VHAVSLLHGAFGADDPAIAGAGPAASIARRGVTRYRRTAIRGTHRWGTGMAVDTGERRVRREGDPAQLRWIAQARTLSAALDRLPTPLLLLVPGDPIRVWQANTAARHRFVDCTDLCVRDGLLGGAEATLDALRDAMSRTRRQGPGRPLRFALAVGGRATTATLEALDFGVTADLPVTEVMLFEVRDAPAGRRIEHLCTEFHLTPKEAEVAVGLYAMGSVEELARCTGRSVHTIRSQLKAAMQKTGRRTQAALVAAVADCLVG
jgi:DNA-binding CsgD family transcriptional regulator